MNGSSLCTIIIYYSNSTTYLYLYRITRNLPPVKSTSQASRISTYNLFSLKMKLVMWRQCLGGIQQLCGQNWHFLTPPLRGHFSYPERGQKNRHFLTPSSTSSCTRSYWIAPYHMIHALERFRKLHWERHTRLFLLSTKCGEAIKSLANSKKKIWKNLNIFTSTKKELAGCNLYYIT